MMVIGQRRILLAVDLALILAVSTPGWAQHVHGTIDGLHTSDQLGMIVQIEDLNGDGVGELVVLALNGRQFGPGPTGPGYESGDLHWFDGATLQPLGLHVAGDLGGGSSLLAVPAGDFDGDGVTDILWHHNRSGTNPYADVHSGATQQHLARFTDPGNVAWGEVLAPLGDLDLDGFDDVGVATHSSGLLRIYGGPDGHLIRVHTGIGGLYNSLASIGDLDGDGIPDYAFGSGTSSAVRLFSGATGTELRRDTRDPLVGFGHSVTGVGDIDGDGVPDYAAGAPGSVFQVQPVTGVFLVSGATGLDIGYLPSISTPSCRMGWTVDGSLDVNGDGVRDLVVTTRDAQYVHVYSLRTRTLLYRVNVNDLPPQSGGSWPYFPFAGFLGDLDGDGLAEWWIADPGYDLPTMGFVGRIWIWRGAHSDADTYCSARPNSLGRAARLSFVGPITVGDDEQRLVVRDAAPSSFAQLFYGTAQVGVAFGDGLLCAGGPLYRLHAPFPLDANGEGVRTIDWTAGPHVAGSGAWLAGSAFGLQVVYRDLGTPGGAGFNTTDAIRVVFND